MMSPSSAGMMAVVAVVVMMAVPAFGTWTARVAHEEVPMTEDFVVG